MRIIVHGGAGNIPDELVGAYRAGCARAAEAGWRILRAGGSAEDAVEAAIRLMEDDEAFDAGRGSVLNTDGEVEMDAAIMEGRDLNVGAVAGVRDIANPITLARRVLESEHVLLIGEGASRYAVERGLARCDPAGLIVPRERERLARYLAERGAPPAGAAGHDTVGAAALDAQGRLAAGVSTGGRAFKRPGRVGDAPCVGCGLYADDALGAAVSTGEGEAIIRAVLAKRAVDALAGGGSPDLVARVVIEHLHRRTAGHAGIIILDKRGRVGCHFNTARMARAWNEDDAIIAQVD